METSEKIRIIKEQFEQDIIKINDLKELNDIRVKYLGKKSLINEMSKLLGSFNEEERKKVGESLNFLRNNINEKLESKKKELEEQEINEKLILEKIDISLPSTKMVVGNLHPMTKIINEIEELFVSLGYDVVEGPEIETAAYSFDFLNIPSNHPARDSQDTFYITEDILLRVQTSSAQVRTMLSKEEKEPIRIISPGKVYRRDDDDATHSHQFAQIEGLVVDKNISLAHLKGTLELFAKKIFGSDREIRFRPSYFPFTEPSLEVDVNCFNCDGKGCYICKQTGWIEILGAGMVHPNVLTKCGYNPKEWTGFAFGMGVERITMLKYGINDVRDLYTNDIRFLKQFNHVEGGE